ncbi:histidine kinase [Gracilibacillus halophilus YIM-C55.5]|uniref:histidine kinase n=2 Tax=Gracilibacillus TaxID=74385 RepID=N4W8K2_9BACI|nr:histidine kinase [Gracilibacillus halophilus YIM-C55.5]
MPSSPNQLTKQIASHYEAQYQEFRQQFDQLQIEKKQESLFTQQWIHQMKTPVSVIQLLLEKEQEQIPFSIRQNLDEELDRIRHGLQLALYQSRLQQFERDFHVDQLYIKQLVTTVIHDYKSSFIRHRTYPKIDIDSDLMIYSDQKWLGFVIEQITSNAIKYSNGDNRNILFYTTRADKAIYLHIQDEGIGIPSQDIRRVFDPFFTGENGRTYRESTGMGLHLAKLICLALDHELSISSVEGKGTTITLRFDQG